MPKDDIGISLIVPVYNSVQSLSELTARVENVFVEQIEDDYELIFVDDGSLNAETWPMLQSLVEQYDKVRALQLMRNFGRTSAVLAGITRAKGNWLIVIDDDLQHRPEDIPRLLSLREHDVVMAQFENKQHDVIAQMGSRLVTWLERRVLGLPSHLSNSSFILIRTEIGRHMLNIHTPYPFLPALFLAVTRDIVGVSAVHDSRHSGNPTFTLAKRLKNFIDLVINNSALLLRVVAIIGVTMAGVSFAYGCYLIISSFIKASTVPGWTSLMIVSVVIGGLVLLSLGVVGEYLVRILRGVESRPTFVLRQEAGQDKSDSIETKSEDFHPE